MVEETLREEQRVCKKCGAVKPLSLFIKHSPSGNRGKTCKQCISNYKKEWESRQKAILDKKPPSAFGEIVCLSCDLSKPVECFGTRNNKKTGIDSVCLECRRIGDRKRYAASKAVRGESAKWAGLKWRFGVTRDEWFALLNSQDGKCAICLEEIKDTSVGKDDTRRRACLDHDHQTGKVRGLLCAKCNKAIGLLRDSLVIITRAADYIRRHES